MKNFDENTILKMNLFGGMTAYIKDNFDEERYRSWLGCADIFSIEPTEEDIEKVVLNEDTWRYCCQVFGEWVSE